MAHDVFVASTKPIDLIGEASNRIVGPWVSVGNSLGANQRHVKQVAVVETNGSH